MTVYETASLSVSILALVVSTIVLVFLAKQISLLSRQVEDATKQADGENERQRKQATMNFMSITVGKLQDLYRSVPSSGSPRQPEFAEKAMERDSAEFLALRDYLHFMEDLCVGVNMDILDREVVRRSLGGRITSAWELYEKWIVRERDELKRPIYDELEDCAKELRELDLVDPRPAYVVYRQDRVSLMQRTETRTETDPR